LLSHIKGETWAEGVREQDSENTFGPKRNEVLGEGRILLNEETYALFS
jgi:hypothetical protein